MRIWITVHEHKNGTDYYAFKSEVGAECKALELFDETRKEWSGTKYQFPKSSEWTDIHELTGGDEYLYIEGPLELGD